MSAFTSHGSDCVVLSTPTHVSFLFLAAAAKAEVKAVLGRMKARIESEEPTMGGADHSYTVVVEPGVFRDVEGEVQKASKGMPLRPSLRPLQGFSPVCGGCFTTGSGHVEILDTAVRGGGGGTESKVEEGEGKSPAASYDPVEAYLQGQEIKADGGGISGSGWTASSRSNVVAPSTGKALTCSKCKCSFASRDEHRAHFK